MTTLICCNKTTTPDINHVRTHTHRHTYTVVHACHSMLSYTVTYRSCIQIITHRSYKSIMNIHHTHRNIKQYTHIHTYRSYTQCHTFFAIHNKYMHAYRSYIHICIYRTHATEKPLPVWCASLNKS
jgi:hypothetical protein